MKKLNFFLLLTIVNFFSYIFGQICNNEYVIDKNGAPVLQADSIGISFPQALGIGTPAYTLLEQDSLVVEGGLRLVQGGQAPSCHAATRGTFWQENQLQVCAQINQDSAFPTFAWQNLRISSGLSMGNANGYEIRDAWGLAFDAFPRSPNTWAVASATCASLGGRLPTISELTRNSEATGFASTISDVPPSLIVNSPYLWTSSIGSVLGSFTSVRVADSSIGTNAATNFLPFICVWESPVNGFQGRKCYGPPGQECQNVNLYYNFDTFARVQLTYQQAVDECNQASASIPTLSELLPLIVNSNIQFNGISTSTYFWTSDSTLVNGVPSVLSIKFTNGQPTSGDWEPNSLNSLWQSSTGTASFFCLGVTPSLTTYPPPSSVLCNGGCFTNSLSKSITRMDSNDRNPNTYDQAMQDCSNSEATLPNFHNVIDNIHNGLPNLNSSNVLWFSNPVISPTSSFYLGTYSSDVASGKDWNVGTFISSANPVNASSYRCIWRDQLSQQFQNCYQNQVGVWSGTSINCISSSPGNANGNGYLGAAETDDWGYTWDPNDRNPLTWSQAYSLCMSFGGRLPYPTELYRIRQNNPYSQAAAITNRTGNYLWTAVSWSNSGTGTVKTLIRLTDGLASPLAANSTAVANFRCVWEPQPFGNTFLGQKCYGLTTSGSTTCFATKTLLWDFYDRAIIPFVSANAECSALGGRLPTLNELIRMVQAGSSGSGTQLWTSSPISSGIATAAWTGTSWTGSYHLFPSNPDVRPFRCIFSEEI